MGATAESANPDSCRKMLSIILPAHNEEDNIGLVYERVCEALEDAELDFEVIFVDDGSLDATHERISSLAVYDARFHFRRLSRNFGHQAALLAGLEMARGDAVITRDCDLQHPPALIPDMIGAWRAGYRVVQMVRDETVDATVVGRTASKL